MARPLTAADRVPQVGDVLTMDKKRRREEVASVFIATDGGVQWRNPKMVEIDTGWFSCGWWWKYISRADGGPTTIEDS